MKKRALLLCLVVVLILSTMPSAAYARTSTRLSVSVDAELEHHDFVPTLTGSLKTSRGTALKYKTVYLYFDGVKVASKRTNSSGKVYFDLILPGRNMDGSWYLRYPGSSTYGSCTSSHKATYLDIHYFVNNQVPVPKDIDDDNQAERVIEFTIYLPGNSTFLIWTSGPTMRSVTPVGSPVERYTGEQNVTSSDFYLKDEGYYHVVLDCGDAQLTSVMLW